MLFLYTQKGGDGFSYKGRFVDSRRHGRGNLTVHTTGLRYEGEWAHNPAPGQRHPPLDGRTAVHGRLEPRPNGGMGRLHVRQRRRLQGRIRQRPTARTRILLLCRPTTSLPRTMAQRTRRRTRRNTPRQRKNQQGSLETGRTNQPHHHHTRNETHPRGLDINHNNNNNLATPPPANLCPWGPCKYKRSIDEHAFIDNRHVCLLLVGVEWLGIVATNAQPTSSWRGCRTR